MKVNFGMGKLWVIIVLVILCIAGYFLYNHHQAQMQIARLEDEIGQVTRELNETQAKLTDETDRQAKAQNLLAEMPKKKEALLSAKNDLVNELKKLQQSLLAKSQSVGKSVLDEMQKEIADLNSTIAADEETVKKLDCHYNCMGKTKYKDARKSSDNGEWDRFVRPSVWTCKTHHYSFTDNIEEVDYRYGVSKCTTRMKENQKRIATLTAELEKNQADRKEKERVTASIDEVRAKLAQLDNRQKNMEDAAIKNNETIVETEKSIAGCQKKITNLNSEIKVLSDKVQKLKGWK